MNYPSANREPGADASTEAGNGSAPLPSLADALRALPGPVFATIDGAHFDDVATLMKGAAIPCRSLFLGVTDREVEAAGPWLASLNTAAATERLLAIIGEKPAVVFWFCAAGEVALFLHLRTLYVAVVPLLRDDIAYWEEVETRPATDYEDTRVFFRHYDPRVLAQVLPALDEGQFMRVLGPASLVVLPDVDGGKPRRAPALDQSVVVPAGPLRLRPGQMDQIADNRAQRSQRRIAAFLKEQGSDIFPKMTDAEHIVVTSERSAKALGIETEAGRARWAYAMMMSGGKAAELPEVTRFIRSGRHSPDEQVRRLLDDTAQALRTGRIVSPRQ